MFFFYFLKCFCAFNVVFLLLKQKRTKWQIWCISLGQRLSISWTERVFWSSIIDFIWFTSIDGASYLKWYCSLMFYACLAHSKNELIQWRGVRRLSVCLSVCCPSVCKLLRKSILLPGKWPDRHQTFTRWTPGQRASRVCSRSRSRSKVTWYANFLGFLEWATPSLTVWF